MTAAKWVDPDPIKVTSAHGLTVLLYRRAPREQPTQPSPPASEPTPAGRTEPELYDDGQDWLCYLDAEERAARAATVASATPTERMVFGLFDDPPPSGAA